jgi:hypothetical protein
MKIGDKVKLEDPLMETLVGEIVDKEISRCKCSKSKWIIDFNGETQKVSVGSKKLSLYEEG